MLIAAFLSRSWIVPQSVHSHDLSRRFNASLTVPQTEQVLLVGYHLSMNLTVPPFLAAMYFNFTTKSANPKSDTLRPQRAFIPCRFKSSSRSSSYASVSWCASFQWKSSRCRSILRCFRAKSSLVLSRLFNRLFFRQWLRLARLIALRLCLKNCGDSISCPFEPVRYRLRPKSKPAILPVMTRFKSGSS